MKKHLFWVILAISFIFAIMSWGLSQVWIQLFPQEAALLTATTIIIFSLIAIQLIDSLENN
ncbi:hypothetical protein [Lentilactobacillus kisonensis]|uniref:Uncharacterized protein n=1 Tax=Lentilactobacillus kisonensis F0435 TaxID=797516 RepID=H1LFK2_9LACO|nr:hypothetical protein [Lentilactobacillus kisonensis]EHO51717.1 hypothetical protein HMPREF9104_01378 [Lentilactobacillus kisonensis F0435]